MDLEPPKRIAGNAELSRRWFDESLRYQFDEFDLLTVECAELAEELHLHDWMARGDDDFYEKFGEWVGYVYDHELALPLEQSCSEGVLLPSDMRAIRLQTCPEVWLRPLRWFFEICPVHIKSYVALYFHTLNRIERARRTGSPEWSPLNSPAASGISTFYRPNKLKFRSYAR